MAALRELQSTSPWPGLLQVAVRGPLQVALWAVAWSAWVSEKPALFIASGLMAAICFASLLSLTHDALHHRLTGIAWLDETLGRLVSWPIAWPIATYKYVHLLHHRLSGSDLADPERISPLAVDWQRSAWRRTLLRHQLWVAMFVAGAAGLAQRLLAAALPRWNDPVVRRALVSDAVGIMVVLGTLGGLAYWAQAWHGVLGFAILWLLHERTVGITHQFRAHMEHYGLWGQQDAFIDTQYTTARSIRTNAFGRLYFNRLNRHAEHHVAPGIPFYKLEQARTVIAAAYQQEGFASVETDGYIGALHEVLCSMRAQFASDGHPPAAPAKTRNGQSRLGF